MMLLSLCHLTPIPNGALAESQEKAAVHCYDNSGPLTIPDNAKTHVRSDGLCKNNTVTSQSNGMGNNVHMHQLMDGIERTMNRDQ